MAGNNVISDDEDEVGVEEEERDEEPADGEGVDERDDDEEEEDEDVIYEFVWESERNYELDEDDYELLQESNISVHRPKLESKKFKRLKKARRDEEGHSDFPEEEDFDESGKRGRTAEEKLKHSLFGDDEGQPLEDIAEEEQPEEEEEDADIGEEDEMADFIVDEEEVDEHGAPVRRKKMNKKKSRQAPGVSSTALQEAHDIFGDVDELLRLRKQGLAKMGHYDEGGEWRERRLEDEFEPIILSEKYMTEKDEKIREIDIPERMQLSEESTGPPTDEMSISEETNWIYNQLRFVPPFNKRETGTSEEGNELPIDKDDIMRFLDLMHVQKLDEECMTLLKDPDQGEVDALENNSDKKNAVLNCTRCFGQSRILDRKWLLLQKRKSALHHSKAAGSEREVDDVDSKFNLHFPPGEVGVDEGQFKRPKRKSQYSICSKAGLWEVASKFGYSSEQFGLQISLEKMLLWNKVSVGPYQRRENDVSSDEEAAPRVMACCWGPGKTCNHFCDVGFIWRSFLDILYAGSLSLRGQNVNDEQRKKNDQQRLLKFMMDHQPHVVVLGAVNLSCTRLKEDIYEIIFKMVEDNPRDVGHEMDNLNIVYGDETLPHLYENSRISADQLPSQSGIVRRAVALGRYLQNPLAMVGTLCGPGREILSWKLSSMENFLTPDEKYGMIEQIMVDATNQVGPRKAASLQRSLVRQQTIFTRKDLLTEHHLGKKVFVNAVGFLRVRRSGYASNSSTYIDLLDDTRIHPESYSLAQELAKDVYLKDVGEDTNDDDEVLEMAIEHVREKPQLLRGVDPYKYADAKQRISKKETLNDIRLELMQGFQDWRRPYVEPSQDEEFYMISGETEDTLSEGRIVQATIRRVQPQKAICALDSGLSGILMKEDSSDDWRDINDLTEKLRDGDILTCRIKSIQKNRYQVFLSCKENDMRGNRFQNNRIMDPFYHEDRSSLPTEQEKARKEKELAKKHFKPRMIVHPRFKNITADEAMEFLSDKEPGESIVRPSSRGPSYLTLTLKVYDGVYAHKDIVEGGKEHKDITSLLRIGKTLKIGDDTFEDLDEVMDRYVDPLVAHLKAMLNYRKFRKGTKGEVDELLRIEKSDNPMRIVYSFGISHEHPGTFILTYIRSSNPHHEYVGLYPKGFKFRKRMFEDLDRLVVYFQRHIDDPHDSAPSIRSVAAMVPMRSPAAGGSSGFGGGWGGSSNDGDWRGGQNDRTPGSRQVRTLLLPSLCEVPKCELCCSQVLIQPLLLPVRPLLLTVLTVPHFHISGSLLVKSSTGGCDSFTPLSSPVEYPNSSPVDSPSARNEAETQETQGTSQTVEGELFV
nr:transcription elongation factor SPT6 homolog [Ipomoea batatas]